MKSTSPRTAAFLEEMRHRTYTLSTPPIAVRPHLAAELIGVSERTLREFLRQGEIRYAKLNRAVLIPTDELHEFIERHMQKVTSSQDPLLGGLHCSTQKQSKEGGVQ